MATEISDLKDLTANRLWGLIEVSILGEIDEHAIVHKPFNLNSRILFNKYVTRGYKMLKMYTDGMWSEKRKWSLHTIHYFKLQKALKWLF